MNLLSFYVRGSPEAGNREENRNMKSSILKKFEIVWTNNRKDFAFRECNATKVLLDYQMPRHPKVPDAAEMRTAKCEFPLFLGIEFDCFRFSFINRFVDSKVTQLEAMRAVRAPQIDMHERAGFHVNRVRGETESFCGH